MKILPVGTKLFLADGQAGMTELIITFRDFANAPKVYAVNWLLTNKHPTLIPPQLPNNEPARTVTSKRLKIQAT